jgi:hypothetical protein
MLVALSEHLDFIVEPVCDGLHRLPLLFSSLADKKTAYFIDNVKLDQK